MMKKSAFTLIELLVVITIIAVLATIALPAFSAVMEKANSVKDSNNLRQIGLASTAYCTDHNDTIFMSGSSFASLLNPQYVNIWKPFQSPFDKRAASELAQTAPVSYDLNKNIVGKSTSDIAAPSNCIMIAPLVATPYPNLTFRNTPSSAPTLDESSNPGKTGGTHQKGKRINVLFQDTHVETMLMADFHSNVTNADTSSTIRDIRWNK